MKVALRVLNDKSEFIKEPSPLVFTSDEAQAWTMEKELDDWTQDDIEKTFVRFMKTALANSADPMTLWTVVMYADGRPQFRIELDGKSGHVIGSKKVPFTAGPEFLDFARMLVDELVDYAMDIFGPASLTATLSSSMEKLSKVLGAPAADFDKSGNIDDLVEEISKNTKAEIVHPKENLNDYICDSVLHNELEEIVDFFANRKVYKDAGVELPKGVLFKGPPGTGKTYAARCIAGTVDCYFMTCTASSLQGMYIGSGAENIRNVFKGAKLLAEKSGKGVIVFIDELDSFGSRGSDAGGSGESDRTLNQLLAEMSGFDSDDSVMVMAATNYPERIDEALMRSGRFGRQITIDYPDEAELTALHEFYFKKLKLDIDWDIADAVALTKNMTPADIKEVANETCIMAIRDKSPKMELKHLDESINKVITKNIRHPDKDPETLGLVTAHECGHVLAEVLRVGTLPVKATNYAYGDAGGFTQQGSILTGIVKQGRLLSEVDVLLGGRAAEQVICGWITTGASEDLSRAEALMRSYFKTYHFAEYKVEELDQIIQDCIQQRYDALVAEFNMKENLAVLKELVGKLYSARVIYASDIAAITSKLKRSAPIC